jgi:hypothetical protein
VNTWTITLHAQGSPLDDPRTKDTVIAAAEALAERFGLVLTDLSTQSNALTATLAADEATAVGFAAELRRSTNAWYSPKNGGRPLWISPRE